MQYSEVPAQGRSRRSCLLRWEPQAELREEEGHRLQLGVNVHSSVTNKTPQLLVAIVVDEFVIYAFLPIFFHCCCKRRMLHRNEPA